MKKKMTKWIKLFCLTMAVFFLGSITSASEAFADSFYDASKIYTEGIYVDDGVYVEPCFEHFRDQNISYSALKVEGNLPEGTEFRLYVQNEPEKESVVSSSTIPTVSGLGVFRVDVLMPGREPVTFQAEIVLEGIRPCREISHSQTYPSYEFVSDYSRDTYNIRRDQSVGGVPGSGAYQVVMHKFSNPSEIYDYVRGLKNVRAHFLRLDISGGALSAPQELVTVGTQVYADGRSFASHEEMSQNRTMYGE